MKKNIHYQTINYKLAEPEGQIQDPAAVYDIFKNDPEIDWDNEQF